MRILVMGGTQFVGRTFVAEALSRGHDITLFNRGLTAPDLFPTATHLRGDRNSDLSFLEGNEWEATVDVCGYFPRHVHQLADTLGDRAGHYVFISSVSVYADPPGPGINEDAPLRTVDDPSTEVIDEHTYGGLKALCEEAAAERFAAPLVIRPSYVVGPHDHTRRFSWWVMRFARGGDVLAPGPPDAPIQTIDARDMAAWMMDLIEGSVSGTFHVMNPPPPFTMAELLAVMHEVVSPPDTSITWVDEDFLLEAGESGETLPLWSGGDPGRFLLAADPARAFASGLKTRPLADTIKDTLEWARDKPGERGPRMTPEREARLLARWHTP